MHQKICGTSSGEPNANISHLPSMEGVCSEPVNSSELVIPASGKRVHCLL